MRDPPVLEVRHYLRDHPAVLLTSVLNSFCQSSSSLPAGFLKGMILSLPTYALSPNPVSRVERQQHAGLTQAIIILMAAVYGSDIQAGCS